ncbi:DUF4266 domain-containing protein [Shewanella baltica]|uniref:Lipoprotein, putative n=1 Tax=Shewanella baltica (strain OS155 / ATCC BAA-1091) TaxID=325240 RepID=A3D3T4_SHEB5|nr:DUF4266 domain-containing protein [Shewanella baltica]ABN61397.1 lipoprotein, putative [Shewanella baltica OS155]AEH13749.1 putative lipoprotein [Shewanella baltica OS117]
MLKPALVAVTLIIGLSGCSNLGVQPWEKGQLARADMALDSEKLDLVLDDHIYFSKEGSSGGRAFAGGGCGCN